MPSVTAEQGSCLPQQSVLLCRIAAPPVRAADPVSPHSASEIAGSRPARPEMESGDSACFPSAGAWPRPGRRVLTQDTHSGRALRVPARGETKLGNPMSRLAKSLLCPAATGAVVPRVHRWFLGSPCVKAPTYGLAPTRRAAAIGVHPAHFAPRHGASCSPGTIPRRTTQRCDVRRA